MSITKARPNQGTEVWITRQNILKRLPKDSAERILKNGITLKLAGETPKLGKPTKLTTGGWNNRVLSEQLWRARDWINDKCKEYVEKYDLDWDSFVEKPNDFRVTLTCNRGEAPCVYAVWGDLVNQDGKLPTKWRFKEDTIPFVPSLFVELRRIGENLINNYERDGYYAKERRRNRATVKALYRLAGVTRKVPKDADSSFIHNHDPYQAGKLRSYEDCRRSAWPTRTATKRNGKTAVTLAVHGNNASHVDCNLNLQFTINDDKLRGKNCEKLTRLFAAVRQLLSSATNEEVTT